MKWGEEKGKQVRTHTHTCTPGHYLLTKQLEKKMDHNQPRRRHHQKMCPVWVRVMTTHIHIHIKLAWLWSSPWRPNRKTKFWIPFWLAAVPHLRIQIHTHTNIGTLKWFRPFQNLPVVLLYEWNVFNHTHHQTSGTISFHSLRHRWNIFDG